MQHHDDRYPDPVEHRQHFLSQLAGAVMTFAMRGERQPWGAEDTAFVFRETFKAAPAEARRHMTPSWIARVIGPLSKRDSLAPPDQRPAAGRASSRLPPTRGQLPLYFSNCCCCAGKSK